MKRLRTREEFPTAAAPITTHVLTVTNNRYVAPTSGKAHDRIGGRSIFPPVSRRSVGIPVCVLLFASLSNLVPFIPAVVSLASRTSSPRPYFAIVCHFKNTRRLNSVLNKHLECSRVLGISGIGPAARVQPTRVGVREGRGKNGPRIAMKLESYSQKLIEQNTRPPPFGRGDNTETASGYLRVYTAERSST